MTFSVLLLLLRELTLGKDTHFFPFRKPLFFSSPPARPVHPQERKKRRKRGEEEDAYNSLIVHHLPSGQKRAFFRFFAKKSHLFAVVSNVLYIIMLAKNFARGILFRPPRRYLS